MKHPILFLIALAIFVFAIVPALFAIMATAGFLFPLFVVGFAFFAISRAKRSGHRRQFTRGQWATRVKPVAGKWEVQPFAPRSMTEAQPLTLQPTAVSQPQLPIDVQVKVEQIRRKVEVLLSYATRFPPFSKDLYLVRQTASEYLPRTLDAYLALPSGSATRIVPGLGLTAEEELQRQLELLDQKLDDIAGDFKLQDFDRLLANRRFLEDRFGPKSA